jgi:hypothetical protein
MPPERPDDSRPLMLAWRAMWPEYFVQKLFHFAGTV